MDRYKGRIKNRVTFKNKSQYAVWPKTVTEYETFWESFEKS